jgi:hypothetical protein
MSLAASFEYGNGVKVRAGFGAIRSSKSCGETLGTTANAVVRHLGVSDIRAQSRGHVTGGTIRLPRMMLEAKRRPVTCQTFSTIVRRSLRLSGRVVWIVTTYAGHRIA